MPLQVHYQQPQYQQQLQLHLHHPFQTGGATGNGLSRVVTAVWNFAESPVSTPSILPPRRPSLPVLQLQEDLFPPLPFGWQKVLNLKVQTSVHVQVDQN